MRSGLGAPQLIALSDNGRYMAVRYSAEINGFSDSPSEIWLYDLQDLLLPPHKLTGGPYASANLVFGPNSRYLAIGNQRETVHIRFGEHGEHS